MSDIDVEVFVAPSDGTPGDTAKVHPWGHIVSLNGQGHLPAPCDCDDAGNQR